jgi:hypothetical protein
MKNVMLRMRDGTRLSTDIYRPARGGAPVEGRFPSLLERTPYNKERGAAGVAQYFVPRGYVVIVQDVRGRYQSEGRWRPIVDDPTTALTLPHGSALRPGRMAALAPWALPTAARRSTRSPSAMRPT